ncbi:uncharacterized protein LOC121952742 [Plectropomus leopardus]|uniref:uncharacterized protein LOC121952742 n=1 Tax=Plectropomus leopardus TaxID=160734 RepID=UPI001C4AA85C|nr:uncharacterized protein LOC121952742 [Plectropomus leopardus]
MISIYMIVTALATTALAKGSIECSFSEPAGVQQCFGAVGQLLIFHLPNTANTDITLKKDDEYIIFKRVKNKTVTLHEEYTHQPQLFTDGTIKLGHAMKRHSGEYVLEEFGSNGVLLKNVKMHLEIQAPVSKPAVSQICLSPEQMNISCSSEGDGVEFILTLDGYSLIQTRGHRQSPHSSAANMESPARSQTEQDTPIISKVTISLYGQLIGNLMCQVLNNVSTDKAGLYLTGCAALTCYSPVVLAVRAVIVTLFLVALCLVICHVHKKTRSITVKEGVSKDGNLS